MAGTLADAGSADRGSARPRSGLKGRDPGLRSTLQHTTGFLGSISRLCYSVCDQQRLRTFRVALASRLGGVHQDCFIAACSTTLPRIRSRTICTLREEMRICFAVAWGRLSAFSLAILRFHFGSGCRFYASLSTACSPSSEPRVTAEGIAWVRIRRACVRPCPR